MKRLLALLSLSALLAACGQGPSEPQATASAVPPAAPEPAAEAALHSGVLTEHMDAEVRPGDDFNAYVNGAWMATAEIPPDRPSNSVGLEVHEQATENVRVIIEESAEGDFATGTDEQKVGDLYNAYMDIQQAINLAMVRRFESMGVEFAYPTRTLYIEGSESRGRR